MSRVRRFILTIWFQVWQPMRFWTHGPAVSWQWKRTLWGRRYDCEGCGRRYRHWSEIGATMRTCGYCGFGELVRLDRDVLLGRRAGLRLRFMEWLAHE